MSPAILHTLSFSSQIGSDPTHSFLTSSFTNLSIAKPPPSTTIRMGGGPRTYPGGVSKWQWKRMQQKKAKQLLKARLARERQIYEMRKRAELNAAVSELERPWEVVEKAPKLFSVTADEQLKVLADRFQKPGGFDLWSEKDGPQLFQSVEGLPSARFFPKGVVHSIKPYGRINHESNLGEDEKLKLTASGSGFDGLNEGEIGGDWRKGSKKLNDGLKSKVFDMNLQDDGSYGVSKSRRRTERK
ncbi:hypothetical protein QVD17_22477 [Tagetes erecta]|uniref:DEAD-box ATP-dependent RNA helicase 33 n=1 Tax=Tagetes erecta TaxID=13708 RepID=A0AAD8NTK0_TARER|nr:hypothetical protein QVD17_22477 [Tagetes erecta]